MIAYADVDKVRKNYGAKGFSGRRVDPKKSAIVGAVFVVSLLTILIALLAANK